MKPLLLGAAAGLALAGCAARESEIETPSDPGEARAEVRDVAGRLVARASAARAGDRLRVMIDAEGLAPGAYAVHIHAVGRCEPPGFESAGPHWNPTEREHGTLNPQGHHLGDLPNLLVGATGAGRLEFAVAGASLVRGPLALLDEDGAALVVHANPDDYRTDPSGNSGARIACGAFG